MATTKAIVNVTVPGIDVHYGVFLDLGDLEQRIGLMSCSAKRAVDIAIQIDGEVHEYTFADFAAKLDIPCKQNEEGA